MDTKGVLIAITGLDATGKTSITKDLYSWLSSHFDVSLFHFGKPNPTLITLPFRFIIRISNFIRKDSSNKLHRQSKQKKLNYFYIIRYLLLAYERYKLMQKVWKTVNKGGIVILDRYKTENLGMMDSPRLPSYKLSGIKKMLARIENKLYERMPTPDLIISLTVSLKVAIERNRKRGMKDDEEFLKERYLLNKNLKFKARRIFTVNTGLYSYAQVLEKIKKLVWSAI